MYSGHCTLALNLWSCTLILCLSQADDVIRLNQILLQTEQKELKSVSKIQLYIIVAPQCNFRLHVNTTEQNVKIIKVF